jgi:hypothetical protein
VIILISIVRIFVIAVGDPADGSRLPVVLPSPAESRAEVEVGTAGFRLKKIPGSLRIIPHHPEQSLFPPESGPACDQQIK